MRFVLVIIDKAGGLTRTLFAVNACDPGKVFSYIDMIYGDHDQFYNAEWKARIQDDLLSLLGNLAGPLIDKNPQEVIGIIESDGVYSASKKSIHYAAVKLVWGTPTIQVNGSTVSGLGSSSTIEECCEWSLIVLIRVFIQRKNKRS